MAVTPSSDTKLFPTKNDLPEDKRVKWLWFVEAHQQA